MFTCKSTLVSHRSPVYPRGQRHTAVSPPVVKHFPPWEQGTLLHLSAVHSSETTINQTDQWSTRSAICQRGWYDEHGITYSEKSFDKIDVDAASLHYYARSKNIGGGRGWRFWSLASCTRRQYRRCKYLTKIRRLSFSALLVPRVSTPVRNRKPVRCLRNYLPPRSLHSIGNFRRMKGAFLFRPFFLSSPVLLLFRFFFFFLLSGDLGLGVAKTFEKSMPLRLSISRPEKKYRRGVLIVDVAFVALLCSLESSDAI